MTNHTCRGPTCTCTDTGLSWMDALPHAGMAVRCVGARRVHSSSIDGAGVDDRRRVEGEVDVILKMGGKLSARLYVCREKETWAHG